MTDPRSDAVGDNSGPPKDCAAPAHKRRVQRHSSHRLLRKPVRLPGGVTVSAERHRGRLMVRVEVPDD